MPQLSIQCDSSDDRLVVDCSLKNEGNEAIFVFAAMWTVSKNGQIIADSHDTYASIDELATLHLGMVVHPFPREKFPEQRFVPFAIAVDPGQTWKRKLTLELPVREFNPYYPENDNSLWDAINLKGLKVCLDYMTVLEGLLLHETPIENAVRLEHPSLLPSIVTLSSETIPMRSRGLRRADKFERFACRGHQ